MSSSTELYIDRERERKRSLDMVGVNQHDIITGALVVWESLEVFASF